MAVRVDPARERRGRVVDEGREEEHLGVGREPPPEPAEPQRPVEAVPAGRRRQRGVGRQRLAAPRGVGRAGARGEPAVDGAERRDPDAVAAVEERAERLPGGADARLDPGLRRRLGRGVRGIARVDQEDDGRGALLAELHGGQLPRPRPAVPVDPLEGVAAAVLAGGVELHARPAHVGRHPPVRARRQPPEGEVAAGGQLRGADDPRGVGRLDRGRPLARPGRVPGDRRDRFPLVFAAARAHRVLERDRRARAERGRDPSGTVDDLQPRRHPVDESEVGEGRVPDVARPDRDGHLVARLGRRVAHGSGHVERRGRRLADAGVECVAHPDRAEEHESRPSGHDPDADECERRPADPVPAARLHLAADAAFGRRGLRALRGPPALRGPSALRWLAVSRRTAALAHRSASDSPSSGSPSSSRSSASTAARRPDS